MPKEELLGCGKGEWSIPTSGSTATRLFAQAVQQQGEQGEEDRSNGCWDVPMNW